MPARPERREFIARTSETLVRTVTAHLREAYPDLAISNADARRMVMAGSVRLNARIAARPGAPVEPGDRIALLVDRARLSRARRPPLPVHVAYEDAHIVVAIKPAGMPTHASADPHRPHLVQAMAARRHVPESSVGVHQRLDAGTSGLVVFGCTDEANRGLARAVGSRAMEKVYLAIVDAQGRPDLQPGQAWTARGALARVGTGRQGRRLEVADEGQAAETAFLVRVRRGGRAVIEARPKTGRQHQIRAHLAAARVPIVGDTRYGGPPGDRLCLHAWRLRLPHPVTGAPLVLEAPAPAGWLD